MIVEGGGWRRKVGERRGKIGACALGGQHLPFPYIAASFSSLCSSFYQEPVSPPRCQFSLSLSLSHQTRLLFFFFFRLFFHVALFISTKTLGG